jgi:hypothetical protein
MFQIKGMHVCGCSAGAASGGIARHGWWHILDREQIVMAGFNEIDKL